MPKIDVTTQTPFVNDGVDSVFVKMADAMLSSGTMGDAEKKALHMTIKELAICIY